MVSSKKRLPNEIITLLAHAITILRYLHTHIQKLQYMMRERESILPIDEI